MKKYLSLALLFCIALCAIVACSGCVGSSSSDSGTKAGTTNLKTYIASSLSDDMGRELASRFNNVVSSYDASSDIVNYVVSGNDLETDIDILSQAILHMLNNKNLIIMNPTYQQVKKFYELIDVTVDSYEKLKESMGDYSSDSSKIQQFVNQFRTVSTSQDIERILNSYGDRGSAPVLDILGFRGNTIYYANVDEPSVYETSDDIEYEAEASRDMSEDISNDEEETEITDTLSRESLISDGCIEWVNDYKSPDETKAALVAKGTALLAANTDNGTVVPTIDSAQKIIHDLTADARTANNSQPAKSRIRILDYVWTYHSFTTNYDYVLVEQNITYHNEDYGCNDDSDNNCWNNKYGWKNMYGPYFHSSEITNKLCSSLQNKDVKSPVLVNDVTLSGANPKTSSGSTTYSKGQTFSIGGNVGVVPTGPTAGINGGVSWTETTARTVSDMSTVRADEDNSTSPKWTFNGATPKWYWKPLWISNKHDQAPAILRKQFDATTNWVWQINDGASKNNYQLWTRFRIKNEVLVKDGTRYRLTNTWHLCDTINLPCRYQTKLTSFLSCDNTAKREGLEKYLQSKIEAFKDHYDIAVISNPKDNIYYLKQDAKTKLYKIEKEIQNSKNELIAAGFGDVGNCKISLKAPADITTDELGSFIFNLSK